MDNSSCAKIKRKGECLGVFNNGFFRIMKVKHFTIGFGGDHKPLSNTIDLYYDNEYKFIAPANGKELPEIIALNKFQRGITEPCRFVSFGQIKTVDVPILVLRRFAEIRIKQHQPLN